MPSLRARLIGLMIDLLGPWRMFTSEEALRRGLRTLRARPLARPTARMRRKFAVESRMSDGQEIIRIAPKSAGRGRVLYLHGGGYVEPAVASHWSFIADMVGRLGLEFVVPRYPLAPEHDVEKTMSFMLALYGQLIQDHQHTPLIVMGDSAGGGLALALLQEVRRLGLPMSAGLILISPWLDATMTAPEQARIEPKDVFLRRAGLLAAARWYAGPLPLEHPWVSPLNGPLDGLPPILVFGSDHDILVTDARRFVERAEGRHPSVAYHEVPGLFHDWPLVPVPFPEANAARAGIGAFVGRCLASA